MFKPFGWEVLEHRYGGARARLKTAYDRVSDFIAVWPPALRVGMTRVQDRVSVLEELDEQVLPVSTGPLERSSAYWSRAATACATYIVGEH